MSVTILNEIDKAELLYSGLEKNIEKVKSLNITPAHLDKLKQLSERLKQKDAELEALRRQEMLKVKENHALLDEMKELMLYCRRAVKSQYCQPEWIQFGVQDKR